MSSIKAVGSRQIPRSILQQLKQGKRGQWSRGYESKAFSSEDVKSPSSVSRLPPHSLLPTKMLARSLLVATVSSHRWLLSPALWFLSLIVHPRTLLMDVNKNFILRGILKSTFYNHFCAGENGGEVKSTIGNIKDMGFKGVILTYAREVVIDASKASSEKPITIGDSDNASLSGVQNPDIEAWRQGVLETVEMIGKGDILALKLTGAGEPAMRALQAREPLPDQMMTALREICGRAVERQARIFIDAEQRSVQPAIDEIALDLMEEFNKDNTAVVYNTYQAYLKNTPATLLAHIQAAEERNIKIGIKLVRGAYINSEPREIIHDTKADTDDSYNSMAEAIIKRRLGPFGKEDRPFPSAELFLATHNRESALLASNWTQEQVASGCPATQVQYGQLLGMADGVSCELLQIGLPNEDNKGQAAPEVFKCLSWGTLSDCLSYLLRRAVENRDAVSRTKEEYIQLRQEAFRRIKNLLF